MSTGLASNVWVKRLRGEGRYDLRLLSFPYAGGAASVFDRWVAMLPSSIDVCAVQLPGRGGRLRESPFTELAPMMSALSEALGPLTERPFVFFGHSMGALISFEFTRYLRRHGRRTPLHLFVSGFHAPQLRDPRPPMRDLPDAELIERLRGLAGTPEEALSNAELMSLFLPMVRADLTICETYTCGDEPPLECSISAYGGVEDERVSREELSAWSAQTRGDFNLRMFAGGHFYIENDPANFFGILNHELRRLAGRAVTTR